MMTPTPAVETRSDLAWGAEPEAPRGIVVGIDGSAESIGALNTAAMIASATRCAVHIVSVIPPFGSYKVIPGLDESESELESLRTNIREVAIRDILEAANPASNWSHSVVTGSVAREVVSAAERRMADLIVLGRRNASGERRPGSDTATDVIRVSSIPVLAVPAEMSSPRCVVVAMDFSDSSMRAARTALALMHGPGTLHLVHVSLGSFAGDSRHLNNVRTLLEQQVSNLFARPGVSVIPIQLTGDPASEVMKFAERCGADLIASGTSGNRILQRFFLGSVSSVIVEKSVLPVLTAPSENRSWS